MGARKRLARFAAISCTHCPFQRKESIDQVITKLSDGGPYGPLTDFIMLGDLRESACASVHPGSEYGHTLSDEYEAAAGVLESIRKVLPKKCNLHFLHGNHDDNLLVADGRRTNPATRDLLVWSNTQWANVYARWKQYPYVKPSIHDQRGCLQIGQMIFAHGWLSSGNSDEMEGLQLAYACGGHAHRCVVRGHTHRPRDVIQCQRSQTVLLPYWVINAGSCGPLQPAWMARRDVSQWRPAIVWGECKVNSPSRFAAREWTAHTEILL